MTQNTPVAKKVQAITVTKSGKQLAFATYDGRPVRFSGGSVDPMAALAVMRQMNITHPEWHGDWVFEASEDVYVFTV